MSSIKLQDSKTIFKLTKACVDLIRIPIVLNVFMWFYIGFFLSSGSILSLDKSLPFFVSLFLAFSFANSLNDFYDRDIDILNKRERPIAEKILTKDDVLIFCLTSLFTLFLYSIYASTFILSISIAILGILYSHPKFNFSKKGFIATATMIVAYYTVPFWYGFILSNNGINIDTIILFTTLVFLNIPILLFKDYKDEDGDRFYKKNTPLVIFGRKKLFYIITAISTISLFLSSYLYIKNTINIYIFIISLVYSIINTHISHKLIKQNTSIAILKYINILLFLSLII